MSETNDIRGRDYLLFGMLFFVVFLLVDNITQLLVSCIFGGTFAEWAYWVKVLSRVVPAVLWFGLFLAGNRISINKFNLNFMQPTEKVPLKRYLVAMIFVVIAIFLNYISWGDFKILAEYRSAGAIGFVAQHIYYLAEIINVTILIILFQKACESWFKKTNIPYGGIIVAITWGLVHIVTQNSIMIGLLAFVYGLGFGSTYLILNRNYKLTVAFLFLMFVL